MFFYKFFSVHNNSELWFNSLFLKVFELRSLNNHQIEFEFEFHFSLCFIHSTFDFDFIIFYYILFAIQFWLYSNCTEFDCIRFTFHRFEFYLSMFSMDPNTFSLIVFIIFHDNNWLYSPMLYHQCNLMYQKCI